MSITPEPTPNPNYILCEPTFEPTPKPKPSPPCHSMTTRSKIGSLRPKEFSDFHLYLTSKPEIEPISYRKAVADLRLRHGMQQEYDALISNATWTLFPRPTHNNVIRNKWVFKIKKKADGSIERFKARLVAKGFDQQDRVDHTETFSLVTKASTIQVVLALVVHFNWPIRQLDVCNAFLQGTFNEEVYVD